MTPSFKRNYVPDSTRRDSELGGEFGNFNPRNTPVSVEHSYFHNLSFSKFVERSRLTTTLPVLGHHVSSIISSYAKLKMVRIGATSIVTLMKNAHSFWNDAVVKYPRNTVGHYPYSETNVKASISVHSVTSTLPIPTLTKVLVYYRAIFNNHFPKAFSKSNREALRKIRVLFKVAWHRSKSNFDSVFAPVRRQPAGALFNTSGLNLPGKPSARLGVSTCLQQAISALKQAPAPATAAIGGVLV